MIAMPRINKTVALVLAAVMVAADLLAVLERIEAGDLADPRLRARKSARYASTSRCAVRRRPSVAQAPACSRMAASARAPTSFWM